MTIHHTIPDPLPHVPGWLQSVMDWSDRMAGAEDSVLSDRPGWRWRMRMRRLELWELEECREWYEERYGTIAQAFFAIGKAFGVTVEEAAKSLRVLGELLGRELGRASTLTPTRGRGGVKYL